MSIFSFHLVQTSSFNSIKALWFPPRAIKVQGLIHAECMLGMTLGSSMLSSKRILPDELVFFAQWENQEALEVFLQKDKLGRILNAGWHVRLKYVRQWGHFDFFQIPAHPEAETIGEDPVVAVTIARMKLLQVPRFVHWGRPVEKLVRDHEGVCLALAATRLPKTVSTFSVWETQNDMLKMVHGKGGVQDPERHAKAMKERERKDFHSQFTTLRFKPIAEFGEWKGRTQIVPGLNTKVGK